MEITLSNGEKKDIKAVWFDPEKLPTIQFIDQRSLPFQLNVLESNSPQETADFIEKMVIRGAPSIGAAGTYGILQSAYIHKSIKEVIKDAQMLVQTRPTAVDLHNCIEIMVDIAKQTNLNIEALIKTAQSIVQSIIEECNLIAKTGLKIIKKGMKILTHCHTGALATVDTGTALSIPILAFKQGMEIEVYVNETRPRLQGGRLTAWELSQADVPHYLIADNVAGFLMKNGKIDIILVGADRIASNGDFANKIGTYSLAVLANFHKIPFYTVAPWNTFDLNLPSGEDIPVEERSADEIWTALSDDLQFHQITNDSSPVYNPAFDITPNSLLSGIIAPGHIFNKPFSESINHWITNKIKNDVKNGEN